jgi:hypothetical protein
MKVEPVMEVSETSRPNLRNVEGVVYAVKSHLDARGNPARTILLPRPVIDGSTVVHIAFRKPPELSVPRTGMPEGAGAGTCPTTPSAGGLGNAVRREHQPEPAYQTIRDTPLLTGRR